MIFKRRRVFEVCEVNGDGRGSGGAVVSGKMVSWAAVRGEDLNISQQQARATLLLPPETFTEKLNTKLKSFNFLLIDVCNLMYVFGRDGRKTVPRLSCKDIC